MVMIGAVMIGLVVALAVWLFQRRSPSQPGGDAHKEANGKRQRGMNGFYRFAAVWKANLPCQRDETRSTVLTDYTVYRMSRKETALSVIAAAAVLWAIGYLFYRSAIIAVMLSSVSLFYPRLVRRQKAERRKEELRRQFKQALYSVSSSLAAGHSVENAFREAVRDMRLLLSAKQKHDILTEFEIINRKVENGESLERALADFGKRSGIDDIAQFADVFATCKRTGGDLIEVARRTIDMIGDKMDIEREIAVLIAQKRFEAKALGVVPFFIVAFLAWGSPDYMAPLYEGIGRLIMTVALAALAFSVWLARKMMDIKA